MSTDILRAIRALLPDAEIITGDMPADESLSGAYGDAPRLQRAELIERRAFRAVRVEGEPEVRFSGFLDGIQRVRIPCHLRGVPIVFGVVAAAIRLRVNRRFVSWGHRTPLVAPNLYMPLHHLGCDVTSVTGGFSIIDTSFEPGRSEPVSRHPAALRAVALEYVRRDREEAERRLAELWCGDGSGGAPAPLFIDGGISGSERVASARCAVGVVKSHQTLYAEGAALDVVMSLKRGERSSVFAIPSSRRATVASWYLRMRDPAGQDAMFGLVRIECAMSDDVAGRADEISRWVLAEASPLALPDKRWDRMAYGIRECEEFLRAIA